MDATVTVAYTSDTARVLDVLRKTAEAEPRVLADPRPVAVCTGSRDTGLSFELRAWTPFDEADVVRSELVMAVHVASRRRESTPPCHSTTSTSGAPPA